jgi:glycosyltransferase involved in cell wall biosynthesis
MGKKFKLGFLFSYNDNWIGGTYYVLNLINSLNLLNDKNLPIIKIFYSDSNDLQILQKIKYPQLEIVNITECQPSFLKRVFNFIYKKLFSKYYFSLNLGLSSNDILFNPSLDNLYKTNAKKLFWIPDFQEHFLPQFFSNDEMQNRISFQLQIANNEKYLLLSSISALNDFNKFYPSSSIIRFVFRFNSFLPNIDEQFEKSVLLKFHLKLNNYFICSNQFWQHKNHIIILKAIQYIKLQGVKDLIVCFTGKEIDYRNTNFFYEIRMLVNELDIEENVRFLGFIDRKEQVSLIKSSTAVIQPSLFEGWSTVIEDAKCLNKPVIASDILVHKEQLGDKGIYFNPHDEFELAHKLVEISNFSLNFDFNYQNTVIENAKNLLNILSSIQKII